MQRPTKNAITQTAHLTSQAVDYDNDPDPIIYAPEDGQIISYGEAGACGNNLRMRRDDHYHSFCHLERSLVSVGQSVRRGEPIGVMGYTGLTMPDDVPAGTHLHHFIQFDDGRYVYPPSLANESFIKLGDDVQKFTKDHQIQASYIATGGAPGKGYDWRFSEVNMDTVGMNMFLNFWREVQLYYDKDDSITREEAIDYVTKNLK